MSDSGEFLLRLEDVTKRYPVRPDKGRAKASGEVTILNGIGLQVRRGELISVVGPSGSGKSTLLRMVLGS